MMEAVRTSETSVYFNEPIRRYIPEGSRLPNGGSPAHALLTVLRVRARVIPCGIYGGQSGTGTSFLRVLQFSPVSIIIPPWLSILIYLLHLRG
jgi:hypothetical protein